MTGRAPVGQTGPIEDLEAVGMRLRRLAVQLERLPAMTGVASLYGELSVDPLSRLAGVLEPLVAVSAQSRPQQTLEPVHSLTWPGEVGRGLEQPIAARGRTVWPGGGRRASPAMAPQASTAPHGSRLTRPSSEKARPTSGGPPQTHGAERLTDAAVVRLTRDPSALSSLLRGNLARSVAEPQRDLATDRSPSPFGGTTGSGPAEPAPSAPRREGRGAWPGNRSRSVGSVGTGGRGFGETGVSARSGTMQAFGGTTPTDQLSIVRASDQAGVMGDGMPAVGTSGGASDPREWPGPHPSPTDAESPHWQGAGVGQLGDDAPWVEPAGATEDAAVRRMTGRPEMAAAGGELPLDEILEALADELELALLRAYGTSGG